MRAYLTEIEKSKRLLESKYSLNAHYMKNQEQITPTMREILVDWLMDVAVKFDLLDETLFLGVRLLDQFLGKQTIERTRLQLVGSVCLWIASKFEEIYFPEIRDFVYICDGAYERKEFLKMEHVILDTLGFNIALPTTYTFFGLIREQIIIQQIRPPTDEDNNTLLFEIMLFSLTWMTCRYELLEYRPSLLAAAALMLSIRCLNMSGHKALFGYLPIEVDGCVAVVQQLMRKNKKKYIKNNKLKTYARAEETLFGYLTEAVKDTK